MSGQEKYALQHKEWRTYTPHFAQILSELAIYCGLNANSQIQYLTLFFLLQEYPSPQLKYNEIIHTQDGVYALYITNINQLNEVLAYLASSNKSFKAGLLPAPGFIWQGKEIEKDGKFIFFMKDQSVKRQLPELNNVISRFFGIYNS